MKNNEKGCSKIDNKFLREQLVLLDSKQTDENIEWQDVADFRSKYIGTLEHRDTCRKGSKIFYEYLNAGWIKDPETNTVEFGSSSEIDAIRKERYKLQTEKIEQNRWLREEARDELIAEHIMDAIKMLRPLDIPSQLPTVENIKSYSLCYSDCHYGVEFCIRGLFNEIINEYNPEIFEKRMWDLLYKVKSIVLKENIGLLHIYDLGDSIDGLLRVSQLWKLRYGVIDSTVKYSEFICNWLNEFTKFVRVRFQMVIDGNHSQLRLLGQPKNTFKNENMSKITAAFIRERMKSNPNFEFVENPTGMIFENLSNYNLLGIHGEVKNMGTAIKDFSKVYKVQLNYLIGGHLHHGKYEEVGQDIEVINIPSIIGIDDYSLSLLKTSNAGAKLFCFEENNGKSMEYSIKLQ